MEGCLAGARQLGGFRAADPLGVGRTKTSSLLHGPGSGCGSRSSSSHTSCSCSSCSWIDLGLAEAPGKELVQSQALGMAAVLREALRGPKAVASSLAVDNAVGNLEVVRSSLLAPAVFGGNRRAGSPAQVEGSREVVAAHRG